METIFDYNPTEEELDELFFSRKDYEEWMREDGETDKEAIEYMYSLRKKENYIRDNSEGAPNEDAIRDSAMRKIVSLIWMRNGCEDHDEQAKEYARKIKDPIMRSSALNLIGGF